MSRKKKKKQKPIQQEKLLEGRLEVTRSGLGYVVIPEKAGDVLVRNGDFNTAMHGDLVRVKVTKANDISGRKEGKVVEVLERKQVEFSGIIEKSRHFAFFIPGKGKQIPDFYIPKESLNGAKDHDHVIVKLVQWHKKDRNPVGEVLTVLSGHDQHALAMQEIIIENGFALQFPDKVLKETVPLKNTFSKKETRQRRDFRECLTFTIDPVDAKDFDDAISIQEIGKGQYEIGVHIADVSHYVQPQTALDAEAYVRATSVYLPDRVYPMLPEKISNELCSLRPHEDKYTFSVLFRTGNKGSLEPIWMGKTIIHSDHRFTYEEVQQIIDTKKGLYKSEILFLNKLTQKIRADRFKKGAINFSSEEIRFVLDAQARPVEVVVKESGEAHQLIEELMLLANRAVASFVAAKKVDGQEIPFPYRVHDAPDEQKLLPFIAFAKKFGHAFDISSPERLAKSYNKMLATIKGKPEQHVLEQLGIRTMAKAAYTVENIGHYGLGFQHYCHFTSPIRRYPDILAHRILYSLLMKKPIADKEMDEKCRHCSERERAALEAERAANKYKQVEFMLEYLGEIFDGVISGVASFGIFVETIAHKCEGLIPMSNLLEYDDFKIVPQDFCLVGLRTGITLQMGEPIKIRVAAANLVKRQLDYEWLPEANIPFIGKQDRKRKSKKNNEKKQGGNS